MFSISYASHTRCSCLCVKCKAFFWMLHAQGMYSFALHTRHFCLCFTRMVSIPLLHTQCTYCYESHAIYFFLLILWPHKPGVHSNASHSRRRLDPVCALKLWPHTHWFWILSAWCSCIQSYAMFDSINVRFDLSFHPEWCCIVWTKSSPFSYKVMMIIMHIQLTWFSVLDYIIEPLANPVSVWNHFIFNSCASD